MISSVTQPENDRKEVKSRGIFINMRFEAMAGCLADCESRKQNRASQGLIRLLSVKVTICCC